MPWIDEAATVRRRSLAALLAGAIPQLQEVRAAFHVVQVTTRRRELGRQGHSHIKKLVIIELLSKVPLGPNNDFDDSQSAPAEKCLGGL